MSNPTTDPVGLTSTKLWASVREYVEAQCPGLPQPKFDKACVAVYEAMRFLIPKENRKV